MSEQELEAKMRQIWMITQIIDVTSTSESSLPARGIIVHQPDSHHHLCHKKQITLLTLCLNTTNLRQV